MSAFSGITISMSLYVFVLELKVHQEFSPKFLNLLSLIYVYLALDYHRILMILL